MLGVELGQAYDPIVYKLDMQLWNFSLNSKVESKWIIFISSVFVCGLA